MRILFIILIFCSCTRIIYVPVTTHCECNHISAPSPYIPAYKYSPDQKINYFIGERFEEPGLNYWPYLDFNYEHGILFPSNSNGRKILTYYRPMEDTLWIREALTKLNTAPSSTWVPGTKFLPVNKEVSPEKKDSLWIEWKEYKLNKQ